ncbi:glycosyltransferase family 2 protein [Geomonas sp. RF6]|uniref:glycosyltransferase n=1 Tax=Geomonas sp. RF6 TaxID=2897342 RepID=UPI001E5C1D0E|nr:glycosyltransferase family 2 protein [Geomonas sp. RF6]UFS71089.1 glycosyltransferase family 2 protein [Geomonas sp. RF6]
MTISQGERGECAAAAKAPFPSFVLITPARNEGQFMETIIGCMVRQTVRPLKWVIVSDGSTDATDEIAQRYAALHDWIEFLRMPERAERHFAGKVLAFNAGLERVKDLPYEVIGNLDADISFEDDYFSFILPKFTENPSLGMAGTPFTEGDAHYDYRFTSIEHVSGQCQLFRRECFESIGGYRPRKVGGIDLVAVLTAQMQGWQTRTFPGKSFVHHRKMGTGMHGSLSTHLKWGEVDYVLGMHPLWEFCRCLYQMTKKPYVVAGTLRLSGYCWAFLSGKEKDLSPELERFRRKSQMARLRKFCCDLVSYPFAAGERRRG